MLLTSIQKIAFVLLSASSVHAATMTLQQGVDGYSGSATKVLIGTQPAPDAEGGVYRLRGARTSLHVRFDLPEIDGVLTRARLAIYLPEARTPNRFTEIFCHEAITGGRQISFDEVTEYDNGRRRGAVDSVELFAPAHDNWPDLPFLPLGVPEGGKWIEFNITPVAEKWIRGESDNHGVVLVPTDPPGRGEPSTWEIDIPTAAYSAEPSLRPKLILEYEESREAADRQVLAGMTDGLRRICDRSTRYGYRGAYGTSYEMPMAANEYEGFQVVLYPMGADLNGVRLQFSDLTSESGERIPASELNYFLEDTYQLRRNYLTDRLFAGKLYEVTDPLLPARPVTAPRQVHTPLYVLVHTPENTAAGRYSGTIRVLDERGTVTELDLAVRIWPYAIPKQWNFHTMGHFIWANVEKFHGEQAGDALFDEYYDFLMAHRFTPTEQYMKHLSPRRRLEELLERGINTVYLNGNFGGSEEEMAQAEKDYRTVVDLEALDYALFYIGDETDKWDEMLRRADMIHARLPGALVMIGGSYPREELLGYIDIYDPQIDGGSPVYSMQEWQAPLIAESQHRGEEFYWYVAAGPSYPYPNVQVEYPLSASRTLLWMTWKYGVTGFEYYCYNLWERNYADDPSERYPNVNWKADGWSRGWPTNADGIIFYPGPISSLRFEALRDGIEDWESLMVLRDAAEALRHRENASQHRDLIDEADRLLGVDEEVVAGFDRYTLDPRRLLAEREKVGELLAKLVPLAAELEEWDAGQMTIAKAAEVRIAKQTTLRRRMLRERHLEACKRLGVAPITEEQWISRWPERILMAQDFDGEGRVGGELVTDQLPPGSGRALAGVAGDPYFARVARAFFHFDNGRAAATSWLRFRYYLSEPAPIEAMIFNLTQNDNFSARITEPTVGRWTEVSLPVEDFVKKSGSGEVQAGDALDLVTIGAGRPGEDLTFLIDDVRVVGLDY